MYLVSQDIELLKRAAATIFQGVKVIESNSKLIDKVNKYFSDNFDNLFPVDSTNLYKCKDFTFARRNFLKKVK